MRIHRIAALLLGLLASPLAQADMLVLVHGWRAGADTWITSGVLPTLAQHGWVDAGVLVASPGGTAHLLAWGDSAARRVYRVQLPAEAPLEIQAAHLYAQLDYLRQRHPEDRLILAGHSAGGVVSRLILVRPGAPRVDGLVTIASPNLGTERALQGLDVVDDQPFFCPGPGIRFLKTLFGGDDFHYLEHSRGALVGLTPAAPGSLIGWLNAQPHPDIRYVSVVRTAPGYAGDAIVPGFSQDLNQVPALRGRAQVYVTPAGHGLNPADGMLLATILEQV
jgi:pimeloyl-ACP methyl ester carboxylesterase